MAKTKQHAFTLIELVIVLGIVSLMLGAAAGLGLLPVGEASLLDAIATRCGKKFAEANAKAFLLGRDAVRAERGSAREARV